jgi:transcriptional regulator with XRE-family HTH domain
MQNTQPAHPARAICKRAHPFGRFQTGVATRTIAVLAGREVHVPSSEGPLLHRRRLGVELRRLRGDRTLEEVAEATMISTSKLSRLENGQGVPQPRDIRDLVSFYELDAQTADRLRRWASAGRSQAWWREFSAALPAGVDTYLDYESGASTIRSYAATTIPPLLQTEAYAIRLYEALPGVKSHESARRLVEVRARRQQLLVESDDAPQLIFLLDEAALCRPFGSPDDVREQLDHLYVVSRQRNVSLRVVPFVAGLHAGLQGLFTILQYTDDEDRDIVALESHTGERFIEQPVNVLEYLRIFDAITRKALDHDESRALISETRDRFHSPKGMP